MANTALLKKVDLFGIQYSVVDYDSSVNQIISWTHGSNKNSGDESGYGVTALAVHGLIEGYKKLND